MHIRPYQDSDLPAVVRLSLRAWAPVFVSLEQTLSPTLYREFYPDWRECQQKAVETACAELKAQTWVAEVEGNVAAFVALKLHPDRLGEIHMIAVDPDYQRRGIAGELTAFALQTLKDLGMSIAMVETGGDPGHAPARQTYERAGFELFAAARYFKKL